MLAGQTVHANPQHPRKPSLMRVSVASARVGLGQSGLWSSVANQRVSGSVKRPSLKNLYRNRGRHDIRLSLFLSLSLSVYLSDRLSLRVKQQCYLIVHYNYF